MAARITRIVETTMMILKKTANPSTAYVLKKTVRPGAPNIPRIGIRLSARPAMAAHPTITFWSSAVKRSRRTSSTPRAASQYSGASRASSSTGIGIDPTLLDDGHQRRHRGIDHVQQRLRIHSEEQHERGQGGQRQHLPPIDVGQIGPLGIQRTQEDALDGPQKHP